jgi:hypothetical protein
MTKKDKIPLPKMGNTIVTTKVTNKSREGKKAALKKKKNPNAQSIEMFFDCVRALERKEEHPYKEAFQEAMNAILKNPDFKNIKKEDLWREVKAFVAKWTELDIKTGVRQRWEMETTFMVGRRLGTWLRNTQKWSNERGDKKGGWEIA